MRILSDNGKPVTVRLLTENARDAVNLGRLVEGLGSTQPITGNGEFLELQIAVEDLLKLALRKR